MRFVADEKVASISFPSNISQDGQEKCNVTFTNHSVPEGTNVYLSLELDFPREQGAGGLCCNIANNKGRWYTVVDLGPSKLHSDENTYICTVYVQADPHVPVTWKAANTSVTGGFSPAIPSTPDPKCTHRKTFVDCLQPYPSACAWSPEGQCLYEPPIECGGLDPLVGPFCIGVYIDGKPFPDPFNPKGKVRSLNSFNLTASTISGANVSTVTSPSQVLKVGQNGWFSMKAKPAEWKVCTHYNEILPSGKSSDPNTAFVACVSLDGAVMDLHSGSTNGLAIGSIYGQSQGWTAKGFDPTKVGLIWAQYVTWSNTTNASTSAPR